MRRSLALCVTLLLVAVTGAYGQATASIPPTLNSIVKTYMNTLAPGTANHTLAYVQTGPNEQKVWFAVDRAPGHTVVYFNQRTRHWRAPQELSQEI